MKKMMFAALSLVTVFAIAGGDATPPVAAAPAPPQDLTCRPPLNGRCQAGCCLLVNHATTPPTLSCLSCF